MGHVFAYGGINGFLHPIPFCTLIPNKKWRWILGFQSLLTPILGGGIFLSFELFLIHGKRVKSVVSRSVLLVIRIRWFGVEINLVYIFTIKSAYYLEMQHRNQAKGESSTA
jgi:hypothetical protein